MAEQQTQATTQQQSSGTGSSGAASPPGMEQMFVFLLPMIIIFYLFLIRPENKRRKEKENLLSAIKAKDKVVTIGGLHGTVVEVDGDDVVLLVDSKKDVKMKFRRSAIDTIVQPSSEEKKS